jgi:mono/diheme cytochrome c family protein
VFASAGCANCHTLKAAGATGSVGPDLDQLQPDASTVSDIVRSGGGGMPSFSGKLSDAEITAVASYVSSVAGH